MAHSIPMTALEKRYQNALKFMVNAHQVTNLHMKEIAERTAREKLEFFFDALEEACKARFPEKDRADRTRHLDCSRPKARG